jgi:acetolactate synthase-1/2/3 large subunit
MIGHGVILGGAYAEVQAFAEKTGIPIITTLLGISAIPESHPLHLGMPGMHGEVHVNRAIQHADVILGIGLRFDDRVTGNTAGFAPQAEIIHVDLDPTEIGKNVPVAVGLVGGAREMITRLSELVSSRHCEAWREEIRGFMRERHESFRGEMSPETILTAIREGSGPGCTVVSDVGQHQMWVAKLYGYQERNSHISSGGAGGDGGAFCPAEPAGLGDLGRRRLPDEHAGDRHHGSGRDPREDGHLQQRVSRHGAAVAAILPRPTLLGDADLESRLREAGGGLRHRGLPGGEFPADR